MRKQLLFSITCVILALGVIVPTGCKKEEIIGDYQAREYSGKFVRDYYTLQCKVTKETPGYFPPQAARAFAYVGLACYESVVHGISNGQSMAGQLNGWSASALPKPEADKEYNWALVANAAIADMMTRLYELRATSENLEAIRYMEEANRAELAYLVPQYIADRSIEFGKAISAAIFEISSTDGGHDSYMDPFQLPYVLQEGDHCWIPTSSLTTPISPRWGECRPMMAANVSETQAPMHKVFSPDPASEFYAQAMAVYDQVNNNTDEEEEIARFWADDPFNTCTPAGHTFNILTQLLEETNATLEKTAVAYAKLGIAENDAFISCWKSKYDYDLIRPVSYIKQHIDPNFATVIGTPPFPAYSSGHSCEIAVGEKIFTYMFTNGDGNYPLADRSQLQYGYPVRHFTNFTEMAEECANSRFYGGIHYPMDNNEGLVTGRKIGDNVNNLLNWPSNPK